MRNKLIYITFLLVLIFICDTSIGQIKYVKKGVTAVDTFPTIQSAIDNSINGDTIILFTGIYNEKITLNKTLTLASTFLLNKDTASIHNTIIDAKFTGNAVIINSPNCVLTGFVIQNGYSSVGAGIYCSATNPAFNNLVIKNCISQGDINGAGAYITGLFTFSDCLFINNNARKGAAIVHGGGESGTSFIKNTLFKGNFASENGSAILAIGNSSTILKIENCVFIKNSGAGVIHNQGPKLIITHSNIVKNTTAAFFTFSGEIQLYNSIVRNEADAEVTSYAGPNVGSITISHSNIKGGYEGVGNVNSEVYFRDTNYIKLENYSSCFGQAGINNSSPFDIFSNIRPMPSGSMPDIGAYESPYKHPSPFLLFAEGGDKKVTLRWTQSPAPGLKRYRIYRSTSPISDDATSGVIVDTISISNSSYVDTVELVNLTKYYYRVKSIDSNDVESGMSNELIVRPNTESAKPAAFKFTSNPHSVKISWLRDPSLKYELYKGVTLSNLDLFVSNISDSTYSDLGLQKNTIYYYAIRAVDSVGVKGFMSDTLVASTQRFWYVSPTGSDMNIGNELLPFKTITKAVRSSIAQDTIIMKAGTFAERVQVGHLKRPLTIGSTYLISGDTSVIASTVLDGTNLTAATMIIDSTTINGVPNNEYVNLVGFTIRKAKGYILENGQRWSLRHMHFSQNLTNGYLIQSVSKLQIDSSVFNSNGSVNNSGALIYTRDSASIRNSTFVNNIIENHAIISDGGSLSDSVVISGNIIKNNIHRYPWLSTLFIHSYNTNIFIFRDNLYVSNRHIIYIHANQLTNKTYFYNNTIVNNHVLNGNTGAIWISSRAQSEINIYNNIIQNNKMDGVAKYNLIIHDEGNGSNVAQLVLKNNIIGQDSISSIIPNIDLVEVISNENNTNYPVEFIDSLNSDYRLRSSDVAIGAGISDNILPSSLKDIYGNPRPNPSGSNPDAGAIESPYKHPAGKLTYVDVDDKKVTLHWTQKFSLDLIKFILYRSESSIPDNYSGAPLKDPISILSNSFTDTNNVVNLKRYYYRLKTVDSSGVMSGFSNEISVVPNTAPASPINLTVEGKHDKIILSWNNIETRPVKFDIYRSLDTLKTNADKIATAITNNFYTDSGFVNRNTNYYYWVRSIDSIDIASLYTEAKLGKLSSYLYIAPSGNDQNDGSYDKPMRTFTNAIYNSFNADTIIVKPGVYSENFNYNGKQIIIRSEKGADSTIIQPSNNNDHIIRTSSYSTINNKRTVQLSGFTIRNGSGSPSLRVEPGTNPLIENCIFTNNELPLDNQGATLFQNCIFTRNNRLFCFSKTDTSELSGAVSFVNTTIAFNKQFSTCTVFGDWKPIFINCIIYKNRSVNNDTVYTNSSLGAGFNIYQSIIDDTIYSTSNSNFNNIPIFKSDYRLQEGLANNSPGLGLGVKSLYIKNRWFVTPLYDFNNTVRFTSANDLPDLGAIENKYPIPTPQIVLTESASQKNMLSWAIAGAPSLAKFKIYRSTVSISDTAGDTYLLVDTIQKSVSQFVDSNGLKNLTKYYYRMKSVHENGLSSAFSNEVVGVPNEPLPGPVLRRTSLGPIGIRIVWAKDTASIFKSYVVQRKTNGGMLETLVSDSAFKDTVYFDKSLERNKSYQYFIRSKNIYGALSAPAEINNVVLPTVWYMAPSANDDTATGSMQQPLSSFKNVWGLTKSSDSIILTPGKYIEPILIGYVHHPLTIGSYYLLDLNKKWKDSVVLSRDPLSSDTLPALRFIGGDVSIKGLTFSGLKGRALSFAVNSTSTIEVEEVSFVNNTTSAASANLVETLGYTSRVIFKNCNFKSNYGNAIVRIHSGNVRLQNNIFQNNRATTAIQEIGPGSIKMNNSSFISNTTGSAVLQFNHNNSKPDSVIMNNNTIGGNSGIGLYIKMDQARKDFLRLRNNIIGLNATDLTVLGNPEYVDTSYTGISKIDAQYNILGKRINSFREIDTSSIINNYPTNYLVFRDTSNNDYKLSAGSIGIGGGRQDVEDASVDLNGLARPFPAGSNVDIGAYEDSSAVQKPTTWITQLIAGNKKTIINWIQLPDTAGVKKISLYRSESPNASTLIVDSIPAFATTYTDTAGLLNNKTYYYRLKSFSTNGTINDFSNERFATTFNQKPLVGKLADKFSAIGFVSDTLLSFSSTDASDPDGVIDSTVWYVNDKRITVGTSVNIRVPQGTNKIQYIIYDNDRDTAIAQAYYTFYSSKLTLVSRPRLGITTFGRDNILVPDTTTGGISKNGIFRYDSSLNLYNGLNTFKVDQVIPAEISVSPDSIVFISNGTRLDGFKINGQPYFTSGLSLGAIVNVTPTIDSARKRIYLGLDNGNFLAISYASDERGITKWNYVGSASITTPAVLAQPDRLFIADKNGMVYGFNLNSITTSTPTPNWSYNLGASVQKSLAVDTLGNIYVVTTNTLFKLKVDNNQLVVVFSKVLNSTIQSAPLIDASGNIILGMNAGNVLCLDRNNGNTLWDYSTGSSIISTPSISNYGNIYVMNAAGVMHVVDSLGVKQWYFDVFRVNGYTTPTGLTQSATNSLHIKGTTFFTGRFNNINQLYAFTDRPANVSYSILGPLALNIRQPIWGMALGNPSRSGATTYKLTTITATQDITVEDKNWTILPNPVMGHLIYIKKNNGIIERNTLIQFTDLSGRVLRQEILKSSVATFNVDHLQPGVIFIKIISKTKQSLFKRIIY